MTLPTQSNEPVQLRLANLISFTRGGSTYSLTDHNRAPLDVSYERIETSRRTARGQRRKYHVADKRTFSLSWTDVPAKGRNTVDGRGGVESMLALCASSANKATLRILGQDGEMELIEVHITDWDYKLTKRTVIDFYYDVSITAEEI